MRNCKYVQRLQLQFVLVVIGNLTGKPERGPPNGILTFHPTRRGKTSTLRLIKRDFAMVFFSRNSIIFLAGTG